MTPGVFAARRAALQPFPVDSPGLSQPRTPGLLLARAKSRQKRARTNGSGLLKLRGLFILRPRHSRFCLPIVPSASFPFCFYFSVVIGAPYRIAGLTPRGARLQTGSVRTSPPCRRSLFERASAGVLQVPELRLDARRTGSSRGTAILHFHRTIATPSPRSRRTGGSEKGFLNRRFKRVFAYFCRGAKVGPGSGGG